MRSDNIDPDYTSPRGISLREAVRRVLEAAERRPDGCLIGRWGDHRYNDIKASGRRIGAHVAVAVLRGDDIPQGYMVRHTCDVRGCVESDHLIVGTPAQNSADAYARSRMTAIKSPRGEARHGSILTAALVCKMRDRARGGEQLRSISEDLGVSYSAVYSAVRGLSWAWLTTSSPVPHGFKWSKPSPFRTPEGHRAQALSLADEGLSLQQIADRLSCSRDTAFHLTQGRHLADTG